MNVDIWSCIDKFKDFATEKGFEVLIEHSLCLLLLYAEKGKIVFKVIESPDKSHYTYSFNGKRGTINLVKFETLKKAVEYIVSEKGVESDLREIILEEL